jgi:hypothetical protein
MRYQIKGNFVIQKLIVTCNALRHKVRKEVCMTGERFLNFITSRGIPTSCFAQRLGCHLSSIKKLKSCDQVPRHYINMLIREFDTYLTGNDLEMLNTA